MCTAATYKTNDFYFGRTLDYEMSYGEEIVITPRNYRFDFRKTETLENHYAIIGMAHVSEGYPLYYDAMNEKGLCMAGLNFVGNAHYSEAEEGKDNISQFEFIPWILSRCASVQEAVGLLNRINLINIPFSNKMPLAELHWLISDKNKSITVEAVKEGINVYDNPAGVLTNNPTFPEQMFNLNNYINLSPKEPENKFSDKINLKTYSRGMGAIGLPGDLSSQSRFVRVAFTKLNSVSGSSEKESVNQFFHILGSVEQKRGCCDLGNGKYEITIYTSCCNADKGIYYYTTYENRRISGIDMHRENLNGKYLIEYPLVTEDEINIYN